MTYLVNWDNYLDIYDDNAATLRAPHGDGSPEYQSPQQPCRQFYKPYLSSSKRKQELAQQDITDKPEQSDSESSDDQCQTSDS